MRTLGLVLLVALTPLVAKAQPSGDPLTIRVGVDPDTGDRIASSIGNGDVKLRQGYSAAAESQIVMWVEARQTGAEPPQVYVVGQQLRYSLPKETKSRGKFGRSDPKDPAFVGTPFAKADLKTRWTEITCVSDVYYCSRIDEHEIALSQEMLTALVAGTADDIPVALTRKNRIDWRVPRGEVLETLKALSAQAGAEANDQ